MAQQLLLWAAVSNASRIAAVGTAVLLASVSAVAAPLPGFVLKAQTPHFSFYARQGEKVDAERSERYLTQVQTLLGQPFIKDDKQTVEKMLASKKARVHGYAFFVVGEGIEKKSTDFAAEVMAQAGKAH